MIETSPSTAGPSAASALGGLATADPSRGYREELEHFAYCVRHGNAVELPRRQGPPAPLPRRGRPGRRRHRPDQQPRHAAEAADRVRPELVRLHLDKTPEGAPAIARRAEHAAWWMSRFPADLPGAVFIRVAQRFVRT